MDIWGPYSIPTHDGYKYFLTIVDDTTQAVWAFLMKSKSEVRPLIISFHKMILTQFGVSFRALRFDELCLHCTTEFCYGEKALTYLSYGQSSKDSIPHSYCLLG